MPNNCSPPGMYSFPFKIQVPDWLPGSVILGSQHEELNLQITYTLKAQFTPVNQKDLADKAGTSVFRAE